MIWHAFPHTSSPWAEISKKCQTMSPIGCIGETYGLWQGRKKHPIIPNLTKSCFFCLGPMTTGKAQWSSVRCSNLLLVSSHGPSCLIENIISLRAPYFISIWSRYFVITRIFRHRDSPYLILKGAWFLKPDFSASGSGKAEWSWFGAKICFPHWLTVWALLKRSELSAAENNVPLVKIAAFQSLGFLHNRAQRARVRRLKHSCKWDCAFHCFL